MNAFKKWLFSITDKFESVKWFTIIRRGLTAATPIIIIGAFALMLISLPIPSYQKFLESAFNGGLLTFLKLIYSSTFDMLSAYMVIVISYKYASTFIEDINTTIVVTLISFASYVTLNGSIILGTASKVFDTTQFFSAILAAILSVKMYLLLTRNRKKFDSYSTGHSDLGFEIAIKSIFPATIIIATFAGINFLISNIFHVQSIQGLFAKGAQMLFNEMGNGFASLMLYSFLIHILWFFGIHGSNVLEPVIQSNFLEVGEHVFSKSFYDVFVSMGGSGTCICMLLGLLIVARNKKIRKIAKFGTLPALFNISEIISIGIPILFNPIFFIPFLFVPMISSTIAYLAVYFELVPMVSTTVTWTTPMLFSGYYATGSIAGSILQLVIITVGTLCYIPFIKLFEEKIRLEEVNRVNALVNYLHECEKLKKEPEFLKRNDTLGQTAKILAAELKNALKNNLIFFYYQPQMNSDGKCIGGEALVRWKHPVVGFIYPPLIIELAKETNLLKDIDALLIRSSCELIKDLEDSGEKDIKVSINIAVASILRDDLEVMIDNTLNIYNVSPASLWIELTENEAFTGTTDVAQVLEQLQSNGHKLLIDDFGMGHTSLQYLQTNKFNIVKLDGSLTRGIEDSEVNQKIVQSIVELSSKLKIDIIAEYVETASQRDMLSKIGCNIYQGYLYSPPLAKEEFIKYYKENR